MSDIWRCRQICLHVAARHLSIEGLQLATCGYLAIAEEARQTSARPRVQMDWTV